METASPNESAENFSFDDLVTILSQNLGVTPESLIKAFDRSKVTIIKFSQVAEKRGHFFRNEVWTIRNEKDDEGYYIIENRAGGVYRVGTTSFKQLDQTTQQMVKIILPIVIDMPTTKFSKGGSAPDSFESFPGNHPADKDAR